LVIEAVRTAEKTAAKLAQKRQEASGSGSVPPQSVPGLATSTSTHSFSGGLPGIDSIANEHDWQTALDPNLGDSADGQEPDLLVNPGQPPAKRARARGPADELERKVAVPRLGR